jgi:hypothetical protein
MSARDGGVVGAVKLIDQGPDSDRFVIAILSEGYQNAELLTFRADATSFIDKLLKTPPFDSLAAAINVYRIDVSSTDSGADDPVRCGGTGATANTYFDATFCSSGTGAANQRILTVDTTLAKQVAHDNVPNVSMAFVLVNSAIYGGSGGEVAVLSKHPSAAEIGIHEMGHSAFGLADEYATPGNNQGGDSYAGSEPIEPNVTTVTDRATIKWAASLTSGTAVPTMTNPNCAQVDSRASPVAAGSVGAFAGARYFHCGIYRPEYDCRMRTLGTGFCAVCRAEIVGKLQPMVRPPPTIGGFTPRAGESVGGAIVTISGDALSGVTQVYFGANAAVTFNVDTDKQITAVAPAGIGSVALAVENPQGNATSGDSFTYTTPPSPPVVTSVTPASGLVAGGTSVTIAGSGFTGAVHVAFGSTDAPGFNVDTDNQITVTSPSSPAGTVDVSVTGPAGVSSASAGDRFTFAPPAPAVTSISPASGPEAGGTAVTVTGSGFTGATQVAFGALGATFSVTSDTEIAATSPAGTGVVDVLVTNPTGVSASVGADQFTFVAAPAVTGIAPAGGPPAGGDTVTINGSGFAGASAVTFGAVSASYTVVSDSSITATTPPGTGAVDVTVTTAAGTSATSTADLFTYSAGPPQVIGLNPNTGASAGGDSVVISGSGFAGATLVNFGVAAATFNVDSDSQITANSPAGGGTVDVTVTTPAGASATSAADQFTYAGAGAPVITGLNPTSGGDGGGDTVIIIGSGFTDATAVAFGANTALFTVDSDIQITATSPAGSGTVDLIVTTPTGASTASPADQFTYFGVGALAVMRVSPAMGSSAGGDQVVITGIGFTGATDVSFGANSAGSFSVDTDMQITATSPAGSGTVDVTITTPAGTSPTVSRDQFTYI